MTLNRWQPIIERSQYREAKMDGTDSTQMESREKVLGKLTGLHTGSGCVLEISSAIIGHSISPFRLIVYVVRSRG